MTRHGFAGALLFTSIIAGCGGGVCYDCSQKAAMPARDTSFATFDARARAGARLNVVFFGASLTWGANATDQDHGSYRAYVADMLREKYPDAHFRFYDAAIGGTGSQLGVFRLERDVKRRDPDLVFLDFSANDDIGSANPETMASYESLVRRLITELNVPVVMVVFPFKWNVTHDSTDKMLGRTGHLAIANAYDVPVGDAIVYIQKKFHREKAVTLEQVWPLDPVHPCDFGYRMFAEAAWEGFTAGVDGDVVCAAPEKMVHADTYMAWSRNKLSALSSLPKGWKPAMTLRVSAWQDALMSRWLDDIVITASHEKKDKKQVPVKGLKPLRVKFNASMVMLFGTKTLDSPKYKVFIDGEQVVHTENWKKVDIFNASAKQFNGNTHLSQVIKSGIDTSRDHELVIEPLFDPETPMQLRIESICVAGGKAKLWVEE